MVTPADDSGSSTRTLAAFDEVARVKARYFRYMDVKDWDAWQALYATSAVMDMRGEAAAMASLGVEIGDAEAWLMRTPETIRRSVEGAMATVTSVHHGHMAEMRLVDPDRVTAIWAMEDVIRYAPGGPVGGFNGYGHYHDSYIYEGGRWLIESVTLTRLLISPVPSSAPAASSR